MADWVDPWSETIRGPWRDSLLKEAAPCHYGCGKVATMREPGKPWRAHKVCAQGNPSQGPLGSWDGEDRESKLVPRALGCGTPAEGQTSGRVCAGLGTTPSCRLCPASPTYWRTEGAAVVLPPAD